MPLTYPPGFKSFWGPIGFGCTGPSRLSGPKRPSPAPPEPEEGLGATLRRHPGPRPPPRPGPPTRPRRHAPASGRRESRACNSAVGEGGRSSPGFGLVPDLRPHQDHLHPRRGWTPPSLRARCGLRSARASIFAPPAHGVPRARTNTDGTDRPIPNNSRLKWRPEERPAGMVDAKGERLHHVDGICHMDRPSLTYP